MAAASTRRPAGTHLNLMSLLFQLEHPSGRQYRQLLQGVNYRNAATLPNDLKAGDLQPQRFETVGPQAVLSACPIFIPSQNLGLLRY
jgi:hypothetical protein